MKKNKEKDQKLRKIEFVIVIFMFLFLISCKQKEVPREILPDYSNKDGIILEVIPSSTELKENSEIILNLKMTNKISNESDVFIKIIAPDFVIFKNSNRQMISTNNLIKYKVKGMSDIAPLGGNILDNYYLFLNRADQDKMFDVVFNYFFEKEVENLVVFCLDFYSLGYTSIKGCEAKVKIPSSNGHPLYISDIKYDLKKLQNVDNIESFLITFTIFFDKNNNFHFYENCKEMNYATYGKINVSMSYSSAENEKEKSKIIDVYKNTNVTFSFVIKKQRNEIFNVDDYFQIKYKYCAESTFSINNFKLNVNEK
ncbi:MAG: hypothetical protein QXS41_02390 [Candidatus Woesearchaeota archaeon]